MNTLDIIVLAVIGVSAVAGLMKGLIKTLFGFVSLILALTITWFFTPSISQMIIDNSSFDEMLAEKTVELLNVNDYLGERLETEQENRVIELVSLPDSLKEAMIKNNNQAMRTMLDSYGIGDYIGRYVANLAVRVLVYLVLFLAVSLFINIVATLLDLISHLPVLHQMNKIGGLLLGGLSGLIFVWLGCLIYSFVLSIQATSSLNTLLTESIITDILFNHNPLQYLIMSWIKG